MEEEVKDPASMATQISLMDSPYKTVAEAAAFLRLSPQTLNNMRSKKEGPSYHKHGRRILYDIEELRAWSMNFKTTILLVGDRFS